MVDLSVKIGTVELKNPIMPASGCFSTDLAQVIDVNRLGALVAKTVSREYRIGNPPPREVAAHPDVDVIEVNISCPTRNPGGGNFAMHEDHTFNVVKRIRGATDKP